MNTFLIKVEALKSRIVSQACPRGTTGGIISQRLRLRLQGPQRRYNHPQPPPEDFSFRTVEHYPPPASDRRSIQKRYLEDDLPQTPAPSADPEIRRLGRKPTVIEIPQPHEAREQLLLALRRRKPRHLIRAFLAASKNPQLIQAIPATTFTEIFRFLDPELFIERYKDIHSELSSNNVKTLGVTPLRDIMADFVASIRGMACTRRLAGKPLSRSDYEILLNCARAVGDGAAAWGLIQDMKVDGIRPDTVCFNHYMAAKCWSGTFAPPGRKKLRVTPYNLAMRKSRTPLEGFEEIRVGNTRGIKKEIGRIFDEMIERGVSCDEKTFTLMMTALGREGDVEGVKAILKRVWAVDVDTLLTQEIGKETQAMYYHQTSPLHPTSDLLFTIAHVFGTNNDIPTALRLVDYFSQQYSVPISRDVWTHLLEWTFVLSIPRSGIGKVNGSSAGKLPLQSVDAIWRTMTSEPYNISPTMPMYDKLVKNLCYRNMNGQMLDAMEEGLQLFAISVEDHERAETRHRSEMHKRARDVIKYDISADVSMEDLRREVEYTQLIKSRNLIYIRRWARLLHGGTRWTLGGRDGRKNWLLYASEAPEVQKWRALWPGRPSDVKKWQDHLPPYAHFPTLLSRSSQIPTCS
ncbi:MAG: hypothetical protein M1827_001405 [Pycnora praestabilis]|nr:MAG: hypothetical protein M1827_001405 [Pycnora praestabilis]